MGWNARSLQCTRFSSALQHVCAPVLVGSGRRLRLSVRRARFYFLHFYDTWKFGTRSPLHRVQVCVCTRVCTCASARTKPFERADIPQEFGVPLNRKSTTCAYCLQRAAHNPDSPLIWLVLLTHTHAHLHGRDARTRLSISAFESSARRRVPRGVRNSNGV